MEKSKRVELCNKAEAYLNIKQWDVQMDVQQVAILMYRYEKRYTNPGE